MHAAFHTQRGRILYALREHAAPLPGSHRKAVIGAATSWRDRGAALLQTEGLLSGSRAGMEALLAVFSGKWQGSVWVLYF